MFAVHGPVLAEDVAGLCARAERALTATPAPAIVCDVSGLVRPDVVAVDALARMQLAARRRGRTVTLRGVSPGLRALLRFAGLCDAVLVEPPDHPHGGTPGEQRSDGAP